ncbi:IS110 family transposase [Luteolibacter marinus]|uniref:IS110 family transposase n=1 Tax=Luteolibacter marinus TaxID=2776705 RepID=UPI001D006CEF|nr:IS110 family transposase [Luteolibacter marinus]
MKTTYFIGLDAHKDSIAIAHALGGSRAQAVYHGTCGGSITAIEAALRKLAKKLGVAFRDLKVCYEAGPTGFVIARRLVRLGLDCVVMAPTKTTRKPNEKVKTDKRDAIKIAREFRNGDIVEVRVPPSADQAIRDVARARTDASDDLTRAKQRLKSFLLCNGHRYSGSATWSGPHMNYLRGLSLADPAQQVVLEEYLLAIEHCRLRLDRLVQKMIELLAAWEWKPVIDALMAFKGFKEVAAMTIVAELGDLRRFTNPRSLMSFLGLVPGEHSSGTKRHQGAITKCGN